MKQEEGLTSAPLSRGQRALWFLERLNPGGSAFVIAGAGRVQGPLDCRALRRALAALAGRHPVLRATFHDSPAGPCQRPGGAPPEVLEEDAAGFAPEAFADRLQEAAFRPFDLGRGPLLRAVVLRRAGGEAVLALSVHHIVADFWSLGVIVRELGALYHEQAQEQAREQGGGAPAGLAAPEITYGEWAAAQEERLAGPEGERLWGYWREALRGVPTVLELPGDRPRPARQGFRGGAVELCLGKEKTRLLGRLGRDHGATLAMTLLAGFGALLGRWAGQERLLIGMPTTGRRSREVAGLVGYLVNPVAVEIDLRGDPGFGELLARVREAARGAFEHQDFPLPLLAERLQPERDPSRPPLVQVAAVLQKARRSGEEGIAALWAGAAGARVPFGPLELESVVLEEPGAQFDLTLELAEWQGELVGRIQYDRDLFDGATVRRLAVQLERLLAAAVAEPGLKVSQLPLLGAGERQQVLVEWNETAPGAGEERTALAQFEVWARRAPEAVAVGTPERVWSYGELDAWAEGLAGRLRELGTRAGDVVGICLERSPELVAAVLAAGKCGAAYLPLDPAHPGERLEWQLGDAGVRVVVTEEQRAGIATLTPRPPLPSPSLPPGERAPPPKERKRRAASGFPPLPGGCEGDGRGGQGVRGLDRSGSLGLDALAYVIYTSGSTGRPKGTLLGQRGLANLVAWHRHAYGLSPASRTTLIAGVGFDASVWEMWPALASGASLWIPPAEVVSSPADLAAWIAEQEITCSFLPTPLAEALLDEGLPSDHRFQFLLTGGDRLHRSAPAGSRFRLVNHYGPTENTVVSTCGEVPAGSAGAPPIGRPISGIRALLLDRTMQPVPPGISGELYVGGEGLAWGYLGRPDLTAVSFLPDPFGDETGGYRARSGDRLEAGIGLRLYRTGDLARFRPDGSLEFLGRADQQVKVRGHRIELGEIEAVLSSHPALREAAVIVRGQGRDARLVACVAPRPGSDLAPADLRAWLGERLPAALVPSGWVLLDALPLTANGKVDRRALTDLADRAQTGGAAEGAEAPSTPTEQVLAGIWCELLGLERVGREDHFFELGGHSLLAARLTSHIREALGVELGVARAFEAPTLAALAAAVDRARDDARPASPPLLPADRSRPLPLSFAQERLWFLEQLEPGSAAYNVPGGLCLRGTLDAAALAGALGAVVARHEALRTAFRLAPGAASPEQAIASDVVLAVPCLDLSGLPAAGREDVLRAVAGEEARQPFDLARPPLLRARLVRLGDRDHALLLTLHHLICDGWSMGLIVRELSALYSAALARSEAVLPPLPVQYADFAAWQRRMLAAGEPELEAQLAFWRDRLAGLPETLELPADLPRPAVREPRGGQLPVRLGAPLGQAVREAARRAGATPFMVLLAAFAALLGRLTGRRDLAVGAPVAGRTRRATEGLVGLFVNTVVLRCDLAGDPSFRELVGRARRTLLDAAAHQDLPFDKLVEALAPERDRSRPPLVQVVLADQAAPLAGLALPGLDCAPFPIESGTAKFDLVLSLDERDGEIAGYLEYCRDLFHRATARRFLEQLERLLAAAVAEPGLKVSELPLLGAGERQQVMVEWNDTEPAAGEERTALAQFEAWARRAPEAPAVGTPERVWSYGELDARAEGLSEHLRGLGVAAGDVVGICLERSPELVAAALAAGKCGAAYLPLDPAHPRERLTWQLGDAGVRVLVTEERRAGIAPEGVLTLTPRPPLPPALPAPGRGGAAAQELDTLAYVIYTSGSTGRPKGILLGQRSLTNLVAWHRRTYGLTPASRTTLVAGVGFDASVWEIWPALASGASLWIPPVEVVTSPPALGRFLSEQGITFCFLATPLAEALLEEGVPEDHRLAALITGGDRLHRAAPTGSRFRLVNIYGPTETTVLATCWEVPAGSAGAPPIGRPIAGVRVLLLDRTLQPVPLGAVGELHVGGRGLAWGYLGRPDLTAASFLPDPFVDHPGARLIDRSGEPGARLYRTGDLARFRPDGALEFLGRADQQVKVRGHRVELGEIEAVLAGHPALREAAVLAAGQGPDIRLVAYVVPRTDEAISPAGLHAWLGERLPAALIPSAWVALEALPLTPNGKVDRRALAGLAVPESRDGDALQAPATPTEQVLAALWSDLLGTERIGRQDHFFHLGGHSLLATRLAGAIRAAFGVELGVGRLFEAPTLAAQAAELDAALRAAALGDAGPDASPPELAPLAPAERAGPLPASFAQERLWFLDQLEPGNPAYNIAGGLRLAGALDAAALAGALARLVERHEALRTTFAAVDGRPVQVIGPADGLAPGLPLVDLSGLPTAARRAEAGRQSAEEAARPFDLARGPLLRTVLLRERQDGHRLLATLHHIVGDGWSMGVLVREVAALYRAGLEGGSASLPELPVQYADYAVWQRRWLSGPALAGQLAWWRERLAGAPAALELPADRPRGPVQSARGALLPVAVPPELGRDLAALARRAGVTPFMVLLAAFDALLLRWSGQEDLLVGTPVANRMRPEIEGLIGFFVNTQVLRGELAGDPSFGELLGRVRSTTLGAYAHQDVPFEKLVEELAPQRDRSRTPLFQVMLAFQNAAPRVLELPGLELAQIEAGSGAAKFDLTLTLGEAGEALAGSLEYRLELFDRGTVERLAGHLRTLLAAAVEDPGRRLSDLPLLTGEEQEQLRAWNRTERPPAGRSIVELFAERAAAVPQETALVAGDRRLTYGELRSEVDCLANRLAALGVRPGIRVGLGLDRCPELVVGLLAVLEAGGAYVPLDPAEPGGRLQQKIADADLHVLITVERLAGRFPAAESGRELPRIVLDAPEGRSTSPLPAPPPAGEDDPAYLIFTSGSTGVPKAAGVTRRGLLNLLQWYGRELGLGEEDRVLVISAPGFDLTQKNLLAPLLAGGAIVLGPEVYDPSQLADLIAREGITRINCTPSAFYPLLEVDGLERLASLATVCLGGEAILPSRLASWLGSAHCRAEVVNTYGPTECSDVVSFHRLSPTQTGPVPIGRPVPNARLLVLDRALHELPVGVPGQLAVGGLCVGLGYLGDAAATAARFVPDFDSAAEPGARLYLTGDLARRRPDGALEFLGRVDHQVKVRGFRVELGEIEAVLASLPGIRQAVAAVWPDATGALQLAAYAAGDNLTAAALREGLSAHLPAPLVPTAYVILDALPLNAHGKVDRRALPPPDLTAAETGAGDFEPPRTPAEELLAGVFAELLGRPRVGIHDDFFALGGHSLLATRVAARVRDLFGVELPVARLFAAPTVEALAREIAAAAGETPPLPPLVPVPRRPGEALPLSFSQERLWFLDQLDPGSPAYNIPGPVRLRGDLDVPALRGALAGLVARHETLCTRFVAGPDGAPAQAIDPPSCPTLPVVDLAGLEPERRAAEAAAQARAEARRPFDLCRGPLLRAVLLRERDGEHRLLLTLHHIVGDGWSMGVLVREVAALYRAGLDGRAPAAGELPELPVQYADYAVWQRRWLPGPVLAGQLAWWRERLAGAPAALELPADRPRGPLQSARGALLPVALPPGQGSGVEALARRAGATPFMVLLAAFDALLLRWSGQEDLLVGSPIAHRTRLATEGLIGFFVNTLVLRGELAGDPTFGGLLGRLRSATLGAYAHQDVPFEKLVEELAPPRDRSRTPLFQVMLALQNVAPLVLELPGLEIEQLMPDSGTAKFDLTLTFTGGGETLGGALEYRLELFDRSTVERLAGHLRTLLAGIVEDPGRRLSELPLLTAEEQEQLRAWNRTAAPLPERSIVDLFAGRAAAQPQDTAVVAGDRSLTYGELRSAVDRLAARLAALGVGPGIRVGLGLDRCPELVTAIVAVLQAGGAYVPLDPAEPAGRLRRKIADAGLHALITVERLAGRFPKEESGRGLPRLVLDAPEGWSASGPPPAGPTAGEDDPAYLIFTSGSTGVPKAAGVTRRGLSNLLRWYSRELGLGAGDRVLVISAPGFDLTQKNLLAPLLAGGTVVLGPEVYDPAQLAGLIARHRITWLNCTPSAFYPLLEPGGWERLASLALVCVGGEALSPARLAPWRGSAHCRAEVVNGYGPTECSDVVSFHRLSATETGTVPIGRPVPNARLLVLDRALRELPVGVPGQLAVGGLCVGLGYLGDPIATASLFVPDFDSAAEPGARLYLTGDLARRRPDGALEFLGRLDHQVKVRGFRVELGEIEAVLASLPGIRQAAAAVWPDATGALQLAAYAAGDDLTATALREGLSSLLPAPLVPTAFVILDSLPLNVHGKVDRRALPPPDPSTTEAQSDDFVPAHTATEEVLAGIFAELLGRPQVGVRDDFFALGGHSLLATRVAARVRGLFGVELPVARLFAAPTVEALAREIAAAATGQAALPLLPPITPVPRRPGEPLPLSFSQERLWFLDQLDPGSAAYNVPAAVRLSGRLDTGLLRRCFDAITARHESLRTTFRAVGDRPVQVVAPALQVALPLVDLAALPAAAGEAEAVLLAEAEARLPFDLAAGPLLRATLVRLTPDEHVALLDQHHIVSDAWSLGLLVGELGDLYEHGAAGHALPPLGPDPLPPLPIQYPDYALWQRSAPAGAKREADLAYWRQLLAGVPALLDLPSDRPRPAVRSGRGSLRQAALPPDLAAGLASHARREGATLFMALLAGFQILLARYAGVRDLVVGAPIANRNRGETERLIGFFVNTLALRADLAGAPGWRELLARSRAAVLGATAHQDLPFERLVEELAPERNLAHAPVFQVVLALQNVPAVRPALAGLALAPLPLRRQDSKFDLGLAAHETAAGIDLGLVFSTDLFDAPRMERLLGHFAALLAAAVAAPETPVWELPLLTAAERHQALIEWNAPPDYPRGGLVHRLFEQQAARTPDRVALVLDGGSLTYGELARRARRVARHLRACGVGPGHLVGVCAERSPELVAGLLGIFMAGGAYLPLDPGLPPERLAFLLADARPVAVLVQMGTDRALPAGAPPRLLLEELAETGDAADDGPAAWDDLLSDLPAYVLYTSGSTGRPKGVVVPHRALANRMQFVRTLEMAAGGPFLFKITLNFDASITEMFGPLVAGATTVVARPGGERDTAYLVRLIREHCMTQVGFTASTLAVLIEDPDFAGCRSLRTVFTGAESVPADLAERFFARLDADLYNRYGPTETTISVTSWRCRRGVERVPPIGRPTAAAEAYVLDTELQPVPAGVPGELYLGGVCVTRGYLGRPELTAAAFVPHPFAPTEPGNRSFDRNAGLGARPFDWNAGLGARLYRSGDLVRWRQDGALEFVGRIDQQVKIRGFRVEPGEIEAVLVQHAAVQEVAVAMLGTGLAGRLVAFVVPGPEAVPDLQQELRQHLARQVPAYMVPADWVLLPALPMLPTGKMDRRALQRLDPGREADAEAGRRAPYEPPTTPFEELLAEIWSEVLRVERVGLHDDFFDLGGHSLQVTQVVLRVKERLGVELAVRRFFEAPTLAGLAVAIAERMAAEADQDQLAEILAALE